METKETNDIISASQYEKEDQKVDMFICSCGSEGITIEKFSDEDELYLSVWERGFSYPMTWIQRLKHIWQILRNGKLYGDQLVLSPDTARALANKLNELAK